MKKNVRRLSLLMRKHLGILAICIAAILLLAGCKKDADMEFPFTDADFSQVEKIEMINGTNGKRNWIADAEDIAKICDFVKPISGTNGVSSKDYYGAWYMLTMYDAQGQALYLITFNGEYITYSPDVSEIYPIPYEIADPTEDEIKAFFSQFESNPK